MSVFFFPPVMRSAGSEATAAEQVGRAAAYCLRVLLMTTVYESTSLRSLNRVSERLWIEPSDRRASETRHRDELRWRRAIATTGPRARRAGDCCLAAPAGVC